MSYIGINIKKIRGVKKLSQSDFADLFNLKRGAIGAYEEGRAEPKVETIMDIAKYFSISLDDLLTRQLSVNDLYRFDIFRKDLTNDENHNLTPKSSPVDMVPVPLVTKESLKKYLDDHSVVSTLPYISIPLRKGLKYRAFEVLDNAMNHNGMGAELGDVIVGVCPEKFTVSQLDIDKVYLIETRSELLFRRVVQKSLSQITIIGAGVNQYTQIINSKDVQAVWQIEKWITKNINVEGSLHSKVKEMEHELNLIKARLGR
jgi:transcriptional regulator with XRE-family HTH domain